MQKKKTMDIVKQVFGGNEADQFSATAFERYLSTFRRVGFQYRHEDGLDSAYWQDELGKFSRWLANTNLIEYRNADGRLIKRHLSRAEYERVSGERMNTGTGALLPYNSVKAFDEDTTPPAFDAMQAAIQAAGNGVIDF